MTLTHEQILQIQVDNVRNLAILWETHRDRLCSCHDPDDLHNAICDLRTALGDHP